MTLNPQWMWIAAAAVAVILVVALVAAVARRRREEIRPLSADAREHFRADWRRVEEMFVDRPATAVQHADELVNELVRARGLSVAHARVADRYRRAHAVIDLHGRGKATTEELRQGLLHYRGLYQDLAGERTDVPNEITTAAEIAPPRKPAVSNEERPQP